MSSNKFQSTAKDVVQTLKRRKTGSINSVQPISLQLRNKAKSQMPQALTELELEEMKKNRRQNQKMMKKVTREALLASQKFKQTDEFLGMFQSAEKSEMSGGSPDKVAYKKMHLLEDYIHEVFNESENSDDSDRNSDFHKYRNTVRDSKSNSLERGSKDFGEASSDNTGDSKIQLYDKNMLQELMASMDADTLRVRNMTEMRAARNQKFGFYDKLCIVTERVKVFSNLFLGKKPKYIKNINQMKKARQRRLQREQAFKEERMKIVEDTKSNQFPEKISESNVVSESNLESKMVKNRLINIQDNQDDSFKILDTSLSKMNKSRSRDSFSPGIYQQNKLIDNKPALKIGLKSQNQTPFVSERINLNTFRKGKTYQKQINKRESLMKQQNQMKVVGDLRNTITLDASFQRKNQTELFSNFQQKKQGKPFNSFMSSINQSPKQIKNLTQHSKDKRFNQRVQEQTSYRVNYGNINQIQRPASQVQDNKTPLTRRSVNERFNETRKSNDRTSETNSINKFHGISTDSPPVRGSFDMNEGKNFSHNISLDIDDQSITMPSRLQTAEGQKNYAPFQRNQYQKQNLSKLISANKNWSRQSKFSTRSPRQSLNINSLNLPQLYSSFGQDRQKLCQNNNLDRLRSRQNKTQISKTYNQDTSIFPKPKNSLKKKGKKKLIFKQHITLDSYRNFINPYPQTQSSYSNYQDSARLTYRHLNTGQDTQQRDLDRSNQRKTSPSRQNNYLNNSTYSNTLNQQRNPIDAFDALKYTRNPLLSSVKDCPRILLSKNTMPLQHQADPFFDVLQVKQRETLFTPNIQKTGNPNYSIRNNHLFTPQTDHTQNSLSLSKQQTGSANSQNRTKLFSPQTSTTHEDDTTLSKSKQQQARNRRVYRNQESEGRDGADNGNDGVRERIETGGEVISNNEDHKYQFENFDVSSSQQKNTQLPTII